MKATSDSTVVRDHSYQDLNPLLDFDPDGTIDVEESCTRIEALSGFLAHYHTLEQSSTSDTVDYGLYLINSTLRVAVSQIRAQCEREREAKCEAVPK